MILKQKILEKGLKMNWIASKIGVSNPLLTMYLNGQRTMPEEKEKLIKELLK